MVVAQPVGDPSHAWVGRCDTSRRLQRAAQHPKDPLRRGLRARRAFHRRIRENLHFRPENQLRKFRVATPRFEDTLPIDRKFRVTRLLDPRTHRLEAVHLSGLMDGTPVLTALATIEGRLTASLDTRLQPLEAGLAALSNQTAWTNADQASPAPASPGPRRSASPSASDAGSESAFSRASTDDAASMY